MKMEKLAKQDSGQRVRQSKIEQIPVESANGIEVGKLRALIRQLEGIGPVVPVGVSVAILSVSRTHVWRLMHEGRLQGVCIMGAHLVGLRSVLRHAEWRQKRHQRRMKRMMKGAKTAAARVYSPYSGN